MELPEALAFLEIETLPSILSIYKFFLGLLSLFNDNSKYYKPSFEIKEGQVFDYLVVGAGSAGAVVANRLTEIGNITVLLIEAGGIPPEASNVPALFPLIDRNKYDWNFYTTNDEFTSQAHATKNIHVAQGKMLGGSSSLNYMSYVRGSKEDYNGWASMGNKGWEWKNVLKYFMKSERLDDVDIITGSSGNLHSTKGPITVTRTNWGPRTQHLFEAFSENYPILLDVNGPVQVGYSMAQFATNNNIRQSTAVSYLRDLKYRNNFYLLLNSLVTKIFFSRNNRAVALEILMQNQRKINIGARKEIIVCAGAINSPKLLLLSGIGPYYHLDKFPNPVLTGRIALDKSQTYPDYQSYVLPFPFGSLISGLLCQVGFELNKDVCAEAIKACLSGESVFAVIALLHPESRGSVNLVDNNPTTPPLIHSGYYSDTRDLERHAFYMEDYVRLINTTYFRNIKSKVVNYNLDPFSRLGII